MHDGGVVVIVLGFVGIILGFCITIAPLIIWRNTNRANRLLALMAARAGVTPEEIKAAWIAGGGSMPKITRAGR